MLESATMYTVCIRIRGIPHCETHLFFPFHGFCLHTAKENPIYVLLETELRGCSPNFHIHVSVSDLYISTISPPIFLQQNRLTHRGNRSQKQECRNWDWGRAFVSGNICCEFSVYCLCRAVWSPILNFLHKLHKYIVQFTYTFVIFTAFLYTT